MRAARDDGLGKLSTDAIGGIVGGSTALVGNIVGNIAGGVAFRRQHRRMLSDRRNAGRAAHAQSARQAMGSIRSEFPMQTAVIAGGGVLLLGAVMLVLLRKKGQEES